MKPASLDRRVPGAKRISGVERLCHRKSAWRRDVLIPSYRNAGSIAEMRAKNEGWRVSTKAHGESAHQESADKLVRAIAMVFQRPGPAPIIGRDQPAVRDGNGLHLAWRPTSCDFYCSAGGRNWPHRFTCRSAPDRGRAHQSWMALIIERPSSRGGASSGNRKPHRITTGNDPVVSFKTTHRNRCHPRLVAPGTLRRVHRRERDEMISSRPQT